MENWVLIIFFRAAMMLAYQPIRSLATINMVAYQFIFFKIMHIDKEIKIKDPTDSPKLILKNSDIKFNAADLNMKIPMKQLNANLKMRKYNGYFWVYGAEKYNN